MRGREKERNGKQGRRGRERRSETRGKKEGKVKCVRRRKSGRGTQGKRRE